MAAGAFGDFAFVLVAVPEAAALHDQRDHGFDGGEVAAGGVVDVVQRLVCGHVFVQVAALAGGDHFFGAQHQVFALLRAGAARGAGGDELLEHAAGFDHIEVVDHVDGRDRQPPARLLHDQADRDHAHQRLAHGGAAELGHLGQFGLHHR